jgi:hypothetical protein
MEKKDNKKIITSTATFFVAMLVFVIVILIKTDLNVIDQETDYKLIYGAFLALVLIPFISIYLTGLKFIEIDKWSYLFICWLSAIAFIVALFIYKYGTTIPKGTENVFQYVVTKIYKQHFKDLLIFVFGVATFEHFICIRSLKKQQLSVGEHVCNYALLFLYLIAFIVNVILSLTYYNYVQAIIAFIFNVVVAVVGAIISIIIAIIYKKKNKIMT